MVDVLEYIDENSNDDPQRAQTIDLLDIMSRFKFIFMILLMRKFFGITHE